MQKSPFSCDSFANNYDDNKKLKMEENDTTLDIKKENNQILKSNPILFPDKKYMQKETNLSQNSALKEDLVKENDIKTDSQNIEKKFSDAESFEPYCLKQVDKILQEAILLECKLIKQRDQIREKAKLLSRHFKNI
ncbi:unnamed protein product [Gordionus sp. m RMFG-2023]